MGTDKFNVFHIVVAFVLGVIIGLLVMIVPNMGGEGSVRYVEREPADLEPKVQLDQVAPATQDYDYVDRQLEMYESELSRIKNDIQYLENNYQRQ